MLIVADNNGVGHVKPFGDSLKHQGEAFWIAGKKLTVSQDNRIKIGKKIMEEHGVLRSDGRRAILIDTGVWWYKPEELYDDQIVQLGAQLENGKYLVRGAQIIAGTAFAQYYEYENGFRFPIDVDTLVNRK